jgi:hypothetical protein
MDGSRFQVKGLDNGSLEVGSWREDRKPGVSILAHSEAMLKPLPQWLEVL